MKERTLCAICGSVGMYMPWGFLIGGGIVGGLSLGPGWDRGAAYLMAFALVVLTISYLLQRVSNRLDRAS